MSSKPEVDISWHERGELPPAGCECEALYHGEWISVIVVGICSAGYCVFEVPENMDDEPPYDGLHSPSHFRPLRTEREKAVDEMVNLIARSVFGSAKCQAEKLYDAGYRKITSK